MLSGVRVIDLSLQLPGPFCTMMMADYGADVIKVDEPVPRARNPFAGGAKGPGLSPAERYLNRGKRSVTLNLKDRRGQEILSDLAETADVFVEGFRPGVARRLGADYETLCAKNRRLVYCSISGFGQDGPLRDVAGHDINYLSYAGLLSLCGEEAGSPTPPAVQVGDLFGGAMMALSGILMALFARQRTGKGRRLDISMTDGVVSMLSIHAALFLSGAPLAGVMLRGLFPCYGVYRCADGGFVAVGALEPWFWKGLAEALGAGDLIPLQYATGPEGERGKAKLAAIFATRTRDEWVRFFAGKDLCVSPVLSLGEALSHPNTAARRMVIDVESPLGGRDRQPGLPIKVEGEKDGTPGRPPRLGEHDDEILGELGYSAERIAALREAGVIRAR